MQLFCHVPKVLRGLLDYVILPLAPAKVLEKTRASSRRARTPPTAPRSSRGSAEGGAEWLPRFLGGDSDREAKDDHTALHPNLSLEDYLRDQRARAARAINGPRPARLRVRAKGMARDLVARAADALVSRGARAGVLPRRRSISTAFVSGTR